MKKYIKSITVLLVILFSVSSVSAATLTQRLADGHKLRLGFGTAVPWAYAGDNGEGPAPPPPHRHPVVRRRAHLLVPAEDPLLALAGGEGRRPHSRAQQLLQALVVVYVVPQPLLQRGGEVEEERVRTERGSRMFSFRLSIVSRVLTASPRRTLPPRSSAAPAL